ncbi:hypothetical protein GGS23DRAFT_524226 [Durotheca rogersii]|uniref:uncharacterized protein n=1 Tax=Durotheca rogersii TaxID=419775 RepID=UPI002221071B|nr:uncharacterized protein GGS23DRAFT_524226 [Durotheca rogersii]KAI5853286.1 hypothetical protein GGS23DRAFT_524226 [Durotheca rogersii]
MASQPDSFPQFSKLPLELRDMIWEYALPEPRVFEVLDSPCSAQPQNTPSARLMFADVRNEPPPSIARVSRDARQAVLRRYKPIVFSGTVKHLDLCRDIILLDSYLQVKRLLKVMRLLSQIESIRRSVTKIALGTSWGLHTGLHLRLFHRSVQTGRNMAKFLEYVSKFRQLETVILVVYQRSAFNLRLRCPDQQLLPWPHYDLCEPYHFNFNVNFNLENYWLRRPYQSRLVRYDPEEGGDKATQRPPSQTLPRHSKQCAHDPQPRSYQVHDLKGTFEGWLRKFTEAKASGKTSYKVPSLETATLTWIYTGVKNGNLY